MTFTDQNSVILLKMTVLTRRSGTLPVPGVASKQQTYHVKTHHTNLDKPFKVLVLMSLCQLLMHTVPMPEILSRKIIPKMSDGFLRLKSIKTQIFLLILQIDIIFEWKKSNHSVTVWLLVGQVTYLISHSFNCLPFSFMCYFVKVYNLSCNFT